MISYKIAQMMVQDAHREAHKNHLAKTVNRPRKMHIRRQLTKLAYRYGLIQNN